MLHNQVVFLFVGPSGSGKTTLTEYIAQTLNGKVVSSYTTRPPRYEGETGHVFISESEFDKLGALCAYTEYNGYRYGVTSTLIDESDFYVIDPAGIHEMLSNYTGKRQPIIIWLDCDAETCAANMGLRGDSEEQIQNRLELDSHVFTAAALDALRSAYDEKYPHPFVEGVYQLRVTSPDVTKFEALSIVQMYDTFYSLSDGLRLAITSLRNRKLGEH